MRSASPTAPRASSWPQPPYADALERELREAVRGEVRFDAGSRALYATDGSNYRQVPIGVVVPRSIEDVIATVAACRKHGAPLLSRGGGTSLAGQCCNVAVVMDFSKYLHHVQALEPQARRARVQPGCVLDRLRDAAEEHHLTFAPDPSTHTHNTLGGMIGNNSCGVHSVMGGKTSDNVLSLDVLTYDGLRLTVGPTPDDELDTIIRAGGRRGEIYAGLKGLRDRYAGLIRERYPKIPRRVSGYNLDELLPENGFNVARALVGSEGTCVTILEAATRLVYSPPHRMLLVLGYEDVFSAGDHVVQVMAHGPIGLEGMDDRLIGDMKAIGLHPQDVELLPKGGGWLLVEFGDDSPEAAEAKARKLMDELKQRDDAPSMKLFDAEQAAAIWVVRRSGLGATAHVPNKAITWEGWEDAAVPPDKLGPYLRDFRKLLGKFGYDGDLYGHFGQGCVHTRIDFDLETQEGIDTFHRFLGEAADLVVRYGGSFSGEHGDGQSKAEFLPKMFGEELVRAFGEFKAIWDPLGKMNPGKIVGPYKPTENLRIGTAYHPPQPVTFFKYPKDADNFGRTVLRCVGVGNCRREHGGTMCPSYQATREEKHSTRGRARMLFEMLRGEVLEGGWRSKPVREALDLCLACKGCKGDCPVNVDMATYKAEFMAHHYRGRLRPRAAYSMGLIHDWSRLAAHAPRLVNFLAQRRPFAAAFKALGGIAQEREVPAYAAQTFTAWFGQRPPAPSEGRPRLILWPDTFTNHFLPATAEAAVEVLEDAGWHVTLPPRPLCCGRALYDWGLLERAIGHWKDTLAALADEIDAGTPVVGLEPACVAAFRDELGNLFPADERAKRLGKQTYLLGEFLQKVGYRPPPLARKALVHAHCHHKAVLGVAAQNAVLGQLGLDFELLDSGCCGMAGAFGFDKDKYALSQQIGERVLLPAVRRAAPDTLIVASGFSCREQIRQGTGKQALHLAEVLQLALRERTDTPPAGAQASLAREPA